MHMRQFMTCGQTIVQHGHPAERLCNKVSLLSVFAVGIRSIIFSTRGPSGHQAGRLSRPDISQIKMDFYGSRRESGGSLSYQKVDIKTKDWNGSANLPRLQTEELFLDTSPSRATSMITPSPACAAGTWRSPRWPPCASWSVLTRAN